MRFVSKLYLLFAGMLALAFISTSLAFWGTQEARFSLKRMDLAHRSYQGHLSLSSHTYQLFKEFGDAMMIGDRDQGVLETKLLAAIRSDIANLRSIIAEEIRLVGGEEVAELQHLARLENQIEDLLEEYQSVLNANYEVPLADDWGRLSRVLDEKVDQDFKRLIQQALDEEWEELSEVQAVTEAKLALKQRLTVLLAVFGAAAAGASLWWLVRDLKEPISRLIRGAEVLARGDLEHRIEAPGNSELACVARAFNRMAGEIAGREQLLESTNRRLEDAVAERTAELERLLATLQAAEAARRRLLADVSHELRTPLTIIRGEADIALRGGDKPPAVYREALEKAREAAGHTAKLVDDLLFIARREAGETRLSIRELDLATLLPEMIRDGRSLAVGGNPEVRFHSALVSAPVRADPDRLRQVLMILLDNALHYGGEQIEVRLDSSTGGFAIAVSDNGPGLSKADQERVFERFFRGSNAAGRYAQGTGLGLPVAKAIVAAHGGDIAIASEPGQGATVTITLPSRPFLAAVS